jgi:anti-sigma factor RsiW
MEHEETFTLMMAALDGGLEVGRREALGDHLDRCESCNREWQALLAIHQLFMTTPALSPAADFAQRTLARLPDTRYRLRMMGVIYVTLLLGGLLPPALLAWILWQLGPALNRPALVRGLLQASKHLTEFGEAVLSAFWQGLSDLGQLASQQPAIVGWLLVMLGAVLLWGGVYNQLTHQRQTS